jgi:NAD(P)H-hydrate epimerase
VDLPSGIHTDTGEILGPAVWAEVTATLGLPKLGLYLHPARSLVGQVVVVDIGLPDGVIAEEGVRRHLFDEEEAREALPVREPDAHKGAAGHVLIVAGSPGLTGAATLAALGAARVGAGLVTVAVPRSLNPILEVKLTEPMTIPVAESEGNTHCRAGLPEILRALEGKRAAAVGPGLSRHPEAEALARELVPALRVPAVLDADGLNAFAGGLGALGGLAAPLIITPHPGEMARLLGCPIGDVTGDRLGVAARVAAETGLIVLLKGAPTVVAEPSGEVWVNPTGNAGLATGGTGDVLTGAIVGLLSQGVEPATAARLGAYLHGLAADILADEVGPVGYLAGEVADTLPLAMDELAEGEEIPEE